MRIAGYILVLVLSAGLLIGLGVRGVWRQQRMLLSYQPVPAAVTKNDVRSSKLGGYEPDVEYSYNVRGKTYQSGHVAPLRVNGSRTWVESVAHRVRAEGSTAYYNPYDPAQAYLLPIGRFRPYGLILAGLMLLGLGLLPLRAGGVFSHEPVSITGGQFNWYDLTPGGSHADRAMGWSAAAVLWYLLGALAVGHYYLATPPAYELKSAVSAVLYAVAGLWPVIRAIGAMDVASRLGVPKAHMTQKVARLHKPIIVRVEQPFLRDTVVRELRVVLTCTRRDGLGSVRYYTASQVLVEDRAVRAGEMIHGEFSFEVPDKKRHASTLFSRWDYPRTDWQIEVVARTAKCHATICFPIIAENAQQQAAKAA